MSDTEQPKIELPIHVQGFVKEGFEKVKDVFREQFETDFDRGGCFAAYYQGELVVNLWGGYIEREAGTKYKEDTAPCFFSSTKSVVAIVIAHLVERGLLDYQEKISKYWPEFGQNGKEDITLETFITHKAGLPCTDEPLDNRLLVDNPRKLGEILAKQAPLWTPGTKHGYHPLSFALYLDQIVRRVDSKFRSLSEYFKEEIAEPFGIDFTIGLPKEQFYRSARNTYINEITPEDFMKDFHGEKEIWDKVIANVSSIPQSQQEAYGNTAESREIPNGSSEGHGSAKGLAKLHSIIANGGILEGKRLLLPNSIERLLEPKTKGTDCTCGMQTMWSLGTMLFPFVEGNKLIMSFGHGGYGGQMAQANPEYKVGFAYGSNHLRNILPTKEEDEPSRWKNLADALYDCIAEKEGRPCGRKWLFFSKHYDEYIASKK